MNIAYFILMGLAILLVIMIHELAHGYIAFRFGDDTAKIDGRLSLNPLKHIDIIGLISLFVFRFGWAKPVPVNFTRLRPQKLGAVSVSLAGCLANFISGFIFTVLLALQLKFIPQLDLLNIFLSMVINYSIGFGVFNLLPIPPLDGSKVILTFLPFEINRVVYKYERFFFMFLMIFAYTGLLSRFTLPLITGIMNLFLSISLGIVS